MSVSSQYIVIFYIVFDFSNSLLIPKDVLSWLHWKLEHSENFKKKKFRQFWWRVYFLFIWWHIFCILRWKNQRIGQTYPKEKNNEETKSIKKPLNFRLLNTNWHNKNSNTYTSNTNTHRAHIKSLTKWYRTAWMLIGWSVRNCLSCICYLFWILVRFFHWKKNNMQSERAVLTDEPFWFWIGL